LFHSQTRVDDLPFFKEGPDSNQLLRTSASRLIVFKENEAETSGLADFPLSLVIFLANPFGEEVDFD
jgi:hypothetical protein